MKVLLDECGSWKFLGRRLTGRGVLEPMIVVGLPRFIGLTA